MNSTDIKIAISGDLGSGKSTVCKLLQEDLGYSSFSMGEAWRRLAEKYNMSILELNQYSESHSLDEEMDQAMAARGREPGNMIFDSRLGWHFVPHSFKIHLLVNPCIAATRILHDGRRGEAEEYRTIEEAVAKIAARKASENLRYLQKYQIDCANLHNYDLVVDTSSATSREIADLILKVVAQWRHGQPFHRLWIAPQTPFPLVESSAVPGAGPIVSLIQIDHDFFALNGIDLLSQGFRQGIALIPATIAARNDEMLDAAVSLTARQYVNRHYSLSLIHQWEKQHDFQYPLYPDLAS